MADGLYNTLYIDCPLPRDDIVTAVKDALGEVGLGYIIFLEGGRVNATDKPSLLYALDAVVHVCVRKRRITPWRAGMLSREVEHAGLSRAVEMQRSEYSYRRLFAELLLSVYSVLEGSGIADNMVEEALLHYAAVKGLAVVYAYNKPLPETRRVKLILVGAPPPELRSSVGVIRCRGNAAEASIPGVGRLRVALGR